MANDVKVLIKSLYDGKGIKAASDGLKDLTKDSKQFTTDLADLGRGIGVVTAGIGSFVFGVKKALDFGQEGANLQRLQNSFDGLTRSANVSGDALFSALDRAARGTVSNSDIILSTNRAMMLGLGADVNQLSNLMEVAAFRGRAMGLSTTQAFNDIVTGVGRGSPMILDNLGIIVDAKNTYDQYAASIGKASSELTKQEKTTALLSRVLEEGNRQMELAGGLTEDTAAAYERLDASAKNFFDNLKKSSGEVLEPVARMLTAEFIALSDLPDAGESWADWAANAINLSKGIDKAAESTEEFSDTQKEAISNAESFDKRYRDLADTLSDTSAIEDNTDALKEQSDAYKAILSNMSKLSDESERFTEDEEKRNERIKELEEDKVRTAIDANKDIVEAERDLANLRTEHALNLANVDKKAEDAVARRAEITRKFTEREHDMLLRIQELRDDSLAKQSEMDEKIADLTEEGTKAIEDQEKARKELLYTILEQKAASEASAGGADITKEEFEFLQQMQVELGLTDAASANAAIAIANDADTIWGAFQEATGSVNDVKTALDAVVHGSPYVARIQIQTVGGIPNVGAMTSGLRRSSAVPLAASLQQNFRVAAGQGYADGGEFTVPGSGSGDRPYVVNLEPGEHVRVTPRGQGNGMVLNLNIANIRSLSDIDYLVQEVQRKMG